MQPTSPDPKFDFMLKNNQPAKKGLGLPHFSKPIKIGLAIILGIFLIIIISSALSGRGKGSSQNVINVLARAQETLRVTNLVQQQLHLQDPETQALAATVSSSLGSDSQQLTAYLTKNNTKLTKLSLSANLDKTTDSQLQTASQNNGLDGAYTDYLKGSLAVYLRNLQTAYQTAGPVGKTILKNSIESTQTLLQSAPLKS